jgi:16S rRNA (cytosine967-C5)-methyltransferase
MTAREVALLTLGAVERQNAWANGYLKKTLAKAALSRRDAALATRLTFGVLQNKLLLDYYIGRFSTMKVAKMESKVRDNLRLALYQLLFLNKIPQSAAVNEAVTLTKKHCKNPRAPGMVNGILRSIIRSLDNMPPLGETDSLTYCALRYSHPLWLAEVFSRLLPQEELESLLALHNREAPTIVQVNTCRIAALELAEALQQEGVGAAIHPWLPDCLILTETGSLEQLSAFREGLFYVQDPAARLAVLAAGPQSGDMVLDACAAPGGKSFACALEMENCGRIVSCDIHPHKRKLIEAGAERLGLSCIQSMVKDAEEPAPEFFGAFDMVLADVPCSGLGVIRKKPEIRYKEQSLLEGLPALQGNILRNASQYVKPGGILLYATCTLRREENEDVIEAFLAAAPRFQLEGFTLPVPVGPVPEGQITLWPHRLETDGFFIAKLRKQL